MAIKNFSTENLRNVFAEENKYESFRSVASNLVHGNAIFELDDDGNERQVSKTDANKAISKVFREICGLSKDDLKSRKKRMRAEKLHAPEIYEIIEDDFEFAINRGFEDNEWFNRFVDRKSHADGDANAFYVDDDQYLIVGKTSGDHHDVTIQQIGAGQEFAVNCVDHSVKIGKDIDLIILGRYDYAKMVQKVAEAFVHDIQNEIFVKVFAAASKLPAAAGLTMTTALSSATKADFDNLIENVEVYNNSPVMIMGTKVALKMLTALADVNWASESQKEDFTNLGRLGHYEGTTLVEIPQRLELGTGFKKLIPNDVLLILSVKDDKFVKFYDEGETEIFETTEKGEHKDDFQTHEVQRAYGCEVVLGRYFGVYDKA